LAPEIAMFGGHQAFIVCTFVSSAAIVYASVRVSVLSSLRIYWFFLGIFALWSTVNVLYLSADPQSTIYFWSFCITTFILWFFYLVAAQGLYSNVFRGYPGIASVGKWIVIAASLCILLTGATNYYLSRRLASPSWLYTTVTMIDRSLLMGLAFFLVLLVSIMARYPISIPRNLVVHSVAFSGILLIQALVSLVDQWTAHQFTIELNNFSSLISGIAMFSWAWFLSRRGDLTHVRTRQRLDPEVEFRLLGQLDSINGILLRAGRK
jgi:hypothetical protein